MLGGSRVFPLDCADHIRGGSSCVADFFFAVLVLMFLLSGPVAAQNASPTCKIDSMGTAKRGETIAVHMPVVEMRSKQ